MANSPKFFTAYGPKPPRKATHPGNRYETKYIEKMDERGRKHLEVDPTEPKVDTYAKIQSYASSQEIHELIRRYKMGDLSAVNAKGVYMDASNMPSNFHEAWNLIHDQKERFMQLPLEVRNKFGNDFDVWAASSGSNEWLEKMGFQQSTKEAKEEAPSNGESEQ